MRQIFVGGPGRSGTSFVADRLGRHPQVAALKDIELKILCEKNGLQDVLHALCETYSPNRGVVALDQFRRMAEALIEGRYGQPALTTAAPADRWRAALGEFTDSLLSDGHPVQQSEEVFFAAARRLLSRIATIARGDGRAEVFLEKTPHSLLAMGFLARLAPGARFLHVMRDPRSIAWSLLSMRWGPDEPATAARWVSSYCRAWVAAEADAAEAGLPLTRVYIEEVSAAPEEGGAWLTSTLGLAPHPHLFRGADPAILNRWTTKASADHRALLDDMLGGWVAHFGYDADRIGWRPCPSVPGLAAGQAEAPEPASATVAG